MAKTIVGLFEEQSEAQAAKNELEQAGLDDNTSVALTFEPELSTRLVEAGIPQSDADVFAEGVKTGHSIVVVQGVADVDAEYTAEILDRHNVLDLSHLAEHHQRQSIQRTTTNTTNTSAANTSLYEGQDVVVPILEEQLTVGKRQVQGGGVRIRTSVEQIPVNEQVTLRDETVTVDRRTIDQAVDPSAFDQFTEQTFEVLETHEQAVVAKEARVVEEVRVNKQADERTETISDTVRRTNVDVEQLEGQTRTSGAVTGTTTSSIEDEGVVERNASRAENTVESTTGLDIDRDGDVGQRDPRNNV